MTAPRPHAPEPPPAQQVMDLVTAYWQSRLVHAAAELGLADLLASGPKTAAELAGPTETQERVLHRFMRTLASMGVLSDEGGGRYGLTPVGEVLRSDVPGSVRDAALVMAGELAQRAWEHVPHSLRTGQTGVEKAFGKPMFDVLADRPEDASRFSQAMVAFHGQEPPAVAAAYDFSGFGTIVDVGGATGHMLTTLLAAHPGTQGILYDLPHVVQDAPALIGERGMTDRVTLASGSFFEAVPSGGDAYVLSHVIHDWNEEQCLTILRNVREVMKADGKLLVVEFVLPEGAEPHPGKILDMTMLVMPGGEERTADEYAQLLAKAGFRMTRVVPTDSPASIVEAVRDDAPA